MNHSMIRIILVARNVPSESSRALFFFKSFFMNIDYDEDEFNGLG